MKTVKGVLIDLGGVVYQGDTPIPGAIEAIDNLRAASIPFRFLTNTTSQPLSGIQAKLEKLGLSTAKESIFTPALAARAYLADHHLAAHLLIAPALAEDFAGLPDGENDAVVVGDAREGFTFAALNRAFRHLQAGADLIALASNRYYADSDGQPSLDVGAFVAALEYASGTKAVVLGKPAPDFFHLAVADMGLAPEEAVMIGDDAEFDIAAAIQAGLLGYLVHTGKWTPEATAGLAVQPTAEFADLTAAIAAIVEQV